MKRPAYLVSGEKARLIPVAKKEELRNTSVTFAMLIAVKEWADSLFSPLGAPTGKRAKTSAWLEPVFKDGKNSCKYRPDGLIVVSNGRTEWRALVEAKVHNVDLDANQIEKYLEIAKNHNIDAVVTISNQFVATPTQSPCEISWKKLKKVSLYHWSWSYLETEAKIQLSKSAVSDPDQAYMLEEYVRYLEHKSAGVREFNQMSKEWGEACNAYFTKSNLNNEPQKSAAVVNDWEELMRCTALAMSRHLGTNVTNALTAKERKDPIARLKAMQSSFVKTGELESRLIVPNAASPIIVEADLTRRSVTVSMSIDAPRDKKRAPAAINWLLRQLKETKDNSILIGAKWFSRIPDSLEELGKVREDVNVLIGNRNGALPRTFEIRSVLDLGGKIKRSRIFVQEIISRVIEFYDSVGQHIVPWQAPPPKPKADAGSSDSDIENQAGTAGEIDSAPDLRRSA
jgi:hypothetical protein